MSAGRRRRRPLLAGLLLASATLLTSVGVLAAPSGMPAAAAKTSDVHVELGTVDPAVPTPGQTVTVSLRVVAGASGLAAGRVDLVRADQSLISRSDVARWADGTTAPSGKVVASFPLPAAAPNGTVPVRLTVPASQIGATRAFQSVPLAVVVRDVAGQPVASLHTFVPVFTRKEFEPVTLTWLLPVTAPADPDLFSDKARVRQAAWESAIGPGSPLDALVAAAQGHQVTWVLDPAIVRPVPTLLADGTGPAPGATTTPQDGADSTDPVVVLAAGFAARLAAASPAIWSLPYADPDLAALGASGGGAGLSAYLKSLVGRSWATPQRTVTTAWPVDGTLRAAGRVGLLSTGYPSPGPDVTLVAASTLAGRSGYTVTAPGRTGTGLVTVAYDDTLGAVLSGATTSERAALATQRILAETLAIVDEQAGTARSFAILPARGFAPDPQGLDRLLTAVSSAPWVTVGSGDAMLAAATAAPKSTAATTGTPSGTPAVAPAAALTASSLAAVLRSAPDVDRLAPVLGADKAAATELAARWHDRLDQALSVRWRGSSAYAAYLTATLATVTTVTTGVRVLPGTLNFLAEQGAVQIVVVNDLDAEIRGLSLVLQPQNARVVVLDAPVPLTVGAHSKATVRVEVRALAAGPVPMTASLRAPDGSTVGTSAEILLRANPPAGWWGWAFAGLNGVLFVVGLVRSLRRKRSGVAAGAAG